jgi:hypothetical protein
VGANKFNIPLVAINTLWYVRAFIAGIVVTINTEDELNMAVDDELLSISAGPTIAVNAILMCLFMYHHIGFMYEIKVGIMSFETYPREEYLCCCVARRS